MTFGCTHWSFLNSTYYAVVNSNFARLRFGQGRGKVGSAITPGLKDWSLGSSQPPPPPHP